MAAIAAFLKIYFALLLLNRKKGQLTPNLVEGIRATCRLNIAKIAPIGNPNGRHLENLFCACSPERKGQLTGNLVGSITVTCRSKELK